MVQEIYVDNLKEILRNKKIIEKKLKIKITNRGKNVFVEGSGEQEFIATEVLQAVNLGFSSDAALRIGEENALLQTLNIKDIVKRNDLERVRARIIGTKGKTLKTLAHLTSCQLSLHDNQIGIIGPAHEIEDAKQAVISLIQGRKQGNVYSRLERQRKKKNTEPDLV